MELTTYSGPLIELQEKIANNKFDPAAIQQVSVDYTFSITKGEVDILDATHPGVLLMEQASVTCAVTNNHIESVTRSLYPTLARTEEDLNRHLSDKENLGRFALPANSQMNYILDVASILQYAVLDPATNTRKLIISEDTIFKVGGVEYGIYHPIIISVLYNESISVLWDTNYQTPMHTLTTNELETLYRTSTQLVLDPATNETFYPDLLDISIPVSQFSRKRTFSPLNRGTGFITEIPFDNKYYFTRVFTGDKTVGWSEMHTTYSNQVYNNDTTRATALLAVADGKLRVEIPQIFFSSGVLGKEVRIDLYTTLGEVNTNLREFTPEEFMLTTTNANPYTSKYSAPLKNLRVSMVYSQAMVTGGNNGKTYEELREEVINNGITNNIPITPEQLDIDLKNLGYELVNYKDYLTENLYLASRPLPDLVIRTPTGVSSIVTASYGILLFASSFNELTNLSTVIDNMLRITVTPDTLYKLVNGLVMLQSDEERLALEQASNDDKVTMLNGEQYLYSPYHYVFDNTSNYFEYRGYYLTAPVVNGKFFNDANETTPVNAVTTNISLKYITTGYELLVEVGGTEFIEPLRDDQMNAQLSFVGINERNPTYLTGTVEGRTESGGFVFKFILESNFDLDIHDYLSLTNFKINEADLTQYWCTLTQDFTLTYSLTNYAGPIDNTNLDDLLGMDFLPFDSICITHETLNLQLGKTLEGLFNSSRPIVGSTKYEYYTEDVVAVYTQDIVRVDESGTIIFTPNPDYPADPLAPPLLYEIEHYAGDPVLDAEGNPTYIHRKGDVILDGTGNPVVSRERVTMFETNLMYIDAKFKYVTEKNGQNYSSTLPDTILAYIENDILPYRAGMLNLTTLDYYPKKTLGKVTVSISKNVTEYINSVQQPVYSVYVPESVYKDTKLRLSIESTVKQIATKHIKQSTFSSEDVLTEIKNNLEGAIITVAGGLLGDKHNLERYTLANGNEATTVGAKLVAQTDGTLKLTDTITVNFYETDPSTGLGS